MKLDTMYLNVATQGRPGCFVAEAGIQRDCLYAALRNFGWFAGWYWFCRVNTSKNQLTVLASALRGLGLNPPKIPGKKSK